MSMPINTTIGCDGSSSSSSSRRRRRRITIYAMSMPINTTIGYDTIRYGYRYLSKKEEKNRNCI